MPGLHFAPCAGSTIWATTDAITEEFKASPRGHLAIGHRFTSDLT